MSRPTYLESKQIMDGGGIVVRICPATSGLPTRMSEAGWKALCKSTRQRERASGHTAASEIRRRLNYCEICKGKIRPKGLEIIPAAEMAALKQHHREEEIMGKVSGKCTACARSTGALSTCHGERLCASCSAVYAAANNRPTVLVESLRKLQPQLLEELAGSPTVQVSVESEALKRIAEAVGYKGEDGEVLVKAVADMANATNQEVADLQAEVERLREAVGNLFPDDLIRALDCPNDQWDLAAIQTAALLDETDRQLDESRRLGLRKNDTMREQWENMAVIKRAIGLPEDCETEQIIATIASMMHAVDRFRNLAEVSEKKADRFAAECDRLASTLAPQTELVSNYIDPYREAMADFGLAVIRGEASLVFAGR